MEVKSVSNVQASLEMNVQNMVGTKTGKVEDSSRAEIPEKKTNKDISPKVLEELVKELEKKFSMLNTQLKISIDKDTDMVIVKVIDKETKKIIRQIPPEYVLKIAKYLDEITGLLYNNKV